MLAPIRDYLALQEPKSSPLLRMVKDGYFNRLSADIDPSDPGFGGTRWIASEDGNVEHLLDTLTSTEDPPGDVWNACVHFFEHLYWHKPRKTVLRTRIEALPYDHPAKPDCLYWLSQSFKLMGNHVERAKLLYNAVRLGRGRGDDRRVARALRELADVNRLLGHHDDGIRQAKVALTIYERLGDQTERAISLHHLARLFLNSGQLPDAEEAESLATNLFPETGQEYHVCHAYRVLGHIFICRGIRDKAIHYYQTSIAIASRFGFHDILFWNHHYLTLLSLHENNLHDAQIHVGRARSHITEDELYTQGRVAVLQAMVWMRGGRLEEARSEASRALKIYELLGTSGPDQERCRDLLQRIQREIGIRK